MSPRAQATAGSGTQPGLRARQDERSVTRAQMAEVDRVMVDELGITLVQMMENAGLALATLARTMLGGHVEGRRVVVAAGTGGNGGGAMVAARRLHGWGALPVVVTTSNAGLTRGAVRHQLRTLMSLGVPVLHVSAVPTLPRGELVIDGTLGYGLDGPARGSAAQLIRWIGCGREAVLALDTPSGVDVDTGLAPGPAVCADTTLTLAAAKPGLLQPHAARHVAVLYVADIGVPGEVIQRVTGHPGPTFGPGDTLLLGRQAPADVHGAELPG